MFAHSFSNKIGMNASLTSAVRGVAPVAGGSVLAWSSQSGLGFPNDYHLVFTLCGIAAIIAAFVSQTVCVGGKKLYTIRDDETQPLLQH